MKKVLIALTLISSINLAALGHDYTCCGGKEKSLASQEGRQEQTCDKVDQGEDKGSCCGTEGTFLQVSPPEDAEEEEGFIAQ